MTLKALVLDSDGTLAETADVKRAAFNQAFVEFGLDWVWGRGIYSQILANALPGAEVEFYTLMRHPEMFNRLERTGLLDKIPRRQQAIYLGLLEAGAAPLRPGIARLLAEAAMGKIKLAICSTSPRAEYELLLFNRFGREMIDALKGSVSGEDLQGVSPIQAYRTCLARLKLHPSEVMVIDDAPNGVAAAASLGMQVVATPSLYTLSGRFNAAKLVVSDLGHPAAPLAVLKGDAQGAAYLSLEALQRVHGQKDLVVISHAA